MTTTALSKPRALFAPGAPRRGFLLGFGATLAVGLLVLLGASISVAMTHAERIMPGVRVAGVEIGGLTRSEAQQRLAASLPSLASGQLSVEVDGGSVAVPWSALTREYDLDAMLDGAYGVARSGNLLTDAVARLRALTRATDLGATSVAARPAALQASAADIVAQFTREPIDATVTYKPGSGFVTSPAVDGRTLDADAVLLALQAAVSDPIRGDATIRLSSERVVPAVTTAAAEEAAVAAARMTASALTVSVDDVSTTLEPDAIAGLITFRSGSSGYVPVIDREALAAALQPMADKVLREPKNASYEFTLSGALNVVPGQTGRELDVAGSVQNVLNAIEWRGRGLTRPSAALAVVTTQPALSTEAAQAAASKMQRLSTWTTYYVPGEGNFWGKNISIPAQDINGQVLAPGEWFNFWDDIGPISTARGYGCGGAIIGGRSVPCGVLAGGICSTSTTLFNAAMRAGLEIGDRTNHYYYISRYPTGLDATVFQTDTYEVNMTFRNDTADPIMIRAFTGAGFVRFDVWGVPDGRTVSLSKATTWNHRAAIDTTVVNSSLAPGTSKRVEYPHDGFDASVTRTVRAANGTVLWENVWVSHYKAVNGIVEVGPAAQPAGEAPAA